MVQDNGYAGCDQAAVRLEWRQGLSDRTRDMDDLDDPNTKSRAVETLAAQVSLGDDSYRHSRDVRRWSY